MGIPPPWRVRIRHKRTNCHHPSTPVIPHLVTDLDDHVNIPLLHFHSLTFLLSLHQLEKNTSASGSKKLGRPAIFFGIESSVFLGHMIFLPNRNKGSTMVNKKHQQTQQIPVISILAMDHLWNPLRPRSKANAHRTIAWPPLMWC